jgi:hypothetical protein
MPGGARSPTTSTPPRSPSSASSPEAAPDLLAEVCGVLEGFSEDELNEPLAT